MKKYYFILAAATAFLAACDNEDNSLNEQPQQAVVTYIQADANENATTRGSVDGTDASFKWNTGDKIAVYADGYKISDALESTYNNTNAATFAFSGANAVTEVNRANFAIYPASLVWDGSSIRSGSASDFTSTSLKLTLPASYTLEEVQNDASPTPMIATNAPDGNLSFKALCPLLRVTVQNIPKQTKRLEFDFEGKKVTGEFTLTSVAPGTTAIATNESYGVEDVITVTMAGNTAWQDNLVINLPVPMRTYSYITITAYDATSGGKEVLSVKIPIKSTGWNPTRKSSRKMTAMLPVFSVSSTKKVIFSSGNLYAANYTEYSSNWIWGFAIDQWDYVGNAKANINLSGNGQISTTGCVDLFGWVGASNTAWTGAAQYGISSSTLENSTNTYGNVINESLKSDWGTLSINTYPANIWRNLYKDEWNYLLRTRSGGIVNGVSNARYTMATINTGSTNVHGLIIFPDGVEIATGEATSWGAINAKSNWETQCNANQWETLADKGCIFLPAAGYRYGTTVSYAGSECSYWTSTSHNSEAKRAYFVYVESTNGMGIGDGSRTRGRSVRLVRDAN